MTKPRTTTDALEIMAARYGHQPGWQEGLEVERRTFAIGEMIRELREQAGLTQAQLARRARTSQSAIARIENADYDALKLETLRKVAAALDVPLIIGLGKKSIRIPVERARVKAKAKAKVKVKA
jgi:ribosome-binding protein aMBF1 (putative translation factor)